MPTRWVLSWYRAAIFFVDDGYVWMRTTEGPQRVDVIYRRIDDDFIDDSISLEQLLTSRDLWYVDFNRTTGGGDVPFCLKRLQFHFKTDVYMLITI